MENKRYYWALKDVSRRLYFDRAGGGWTEDVSNALLMDCADDWSPFVYDLLSPRREGDRVVRIEATLREVDDA